MYDKEKDKLMLNYLEKKSSAARDSMKKKVKKTEENCETFLKKAEAINKKINKIIEKIGIFNSGIQWETESSYSFFLTLDCKFFEGMLLDSVIKNLKDVLSKIKEIQSIKKITTLQDKKNIVLFINLKPEKK